MAEFGSLVNLIATTSKVAEVGDGATIVGWTDRRAATVVYVLRNGREVVVQYDKATRVDSNGMSDAQSYTFERDNDGATRVFTLRKNGDYREKGLEGGAKLLVGVRDHYHDYSF